MRLIAITIAVALTMTSAAEAAAPAVTAAAVEQPRAFGHVIGDVLTQRILLKSGDHDAGAIAMPSTGRIGVWFERRNPRIETDPDGRRWLAIDYQITNAPQTLTTIALPALTLSSPSGAALQVPEWPVSVSPLTPQTAFATGDLQALRPDRQAQAAATAPLRAQMAWALGLLALTLLAWLGWRQWRNRREAARLPFARAWSEMQRSKTADIDNNAHAWLCVHRALNETAGQVVHVGSLPGLLARAPHLQTLRPQLERFYQHSGERFFASGAASQAASHSTAASFPLLDFCRELYRAERRHQR
jgi:mxaA protein